MTVAWIDTPGSTIGNASASVDFVVSDAPDVVISIYYGNDRPTEVAWVGGTGDFSGFQFGYRNSSRIVSGNDQTFSIVREGHWQQNFSVVVSEGGGGVHHLTHELPGASPADLIESANLQFSGGAIVGSLGEKISAMDADIGAAQASADSHAAQHESAGSQPITGTNLSLVATPTNYSTAGNTLGQHRTGIDTAIGAAASAASAAQTSANTAQSTANAHASSHLSGAGSNEIDADRLDIDFVPTYYTAVAASPYTTLTAELTSHLKGLENAIHNPGGQFSFSSQTTSQTLSPFQEKAFTLSSDITVTLGTFADGEEAWLGIHGDNAGYTITLDAGSGKTIAGVSQTIVMDMPGQSYHLRYRSSASAFYLMG